MFNGISRKLQTVKKLFDNRNVQKDKEENNTYWKLGDERDFPEQISAIIHEIDEAKLREVLPEFDSYPKNEKDFYIKRFSKYLYEIKNATIDPDESLVILNNEYVFRRSYLLMEDPWGGADRMPSYRKFISGDKKVTHLKNGILIKFDFTNYYHFIIDTIPQFEMPDECGIAADVPIIVPHHFYKHQFIRDYFEKIRPSKRKIIIQEPDQYLTVDQLYIAKDVYYSKHILDFSRAAKGDPSVTAPSKIFVKRHKNVGRTIANMEEIEELMMSKGYTVIEPGDYTFMQQISLFGNAEQIVSLHGAGLTNLIFSKKANKRIVEIFKGGAECPDHYNNLSAIYGYEYRSVSGGIPGERNNFHLDKDALSKVLGE